MLPDSLLNINSLVFFELGLFIFFALLVLIVPRKFDNIFDSLSQPFNYVSDRRFLAVFLVAVIAFSGSMLVSLTVRFPIPTIHDEFSYLLAADTFASGRIKTPPHPLWQHFESLHILQQPAYASKFPPGQGLILAFGTLVGGHPVVGVWLSIAIACGGICWMLQGWVPKKWALLGGLIAALNLGWFGYWSQKYWGGAVAAAGGALIFGAMGRIKEKPAFSTAALLGIGLIVLANSRPLEGLLASLPAASVMLFWSIKSPNDGMLYNLKKIVLPVFAVLLLGAALMGYYNYRITGNPLVMPYQIYLNSYPNAPLFLWQDIKAENSYAHQVFFDLYQSFIKGHNWMSTLDGFIISLILKFSLNACFYYRGVFLIALILLPKVYRNSGNTFAIVTICLVTSIVMLETQSFPRKLAPVAGLYVFILIQCLRELYAINLRDKPVGKSFVGAIVMVFLISVMASYHPFLQSPAWPESRKRAEIIRQLEKDALKHLVIVRYGPNNNPHFDWVYNGADIDAAKIVWARELDETQNRKLVNYYNNRKIWLLVPNIHEMENIEMIPYPRNYSSPVLTQ